jgi:hypothetical protein
VCRGVDKGAKRKEPSRGTAPGQTTPCRADAAPWAHRPGVPRAVARRGRPRQTRPEVGHVTVRRRRARRPAPARSAPCAPRVVSTTHAVTVRRPSHGQASTSWAKTRRSKSAQWEATPTRAGRRTGCRAAWARRGYPSGIGDQRAELVARGAGRAEHPAYRTRWRLGGGMIATRRCKNATGSSTRWVRPSGQGRLSWYEIRPSGVQARRS